MDELSTPLISTGIAVAVTLVIYFVFKRLGVRAVRRIVDKDPERAARVETLWLMLRRVVVAVLLVTLALTVLSIWGVSLAPLLAVSAVFGAAIGFGAQDLVKDLLAGFFILAEDQYQLGDTVNIAGKTGTVDDIQFRVTVLRDLEGNVHFIPNGQIVVTSNFTSMFAQPVIDVDVAYKEDVDHAIEVMLDELTQLSNDPAWASKIRGPAEMMGVNKLGDSGITLRGRLMTVADERWTVRRESLRRIKNRFDAEGIEIPFPHVTVYQENT